MADPKLVKTIGIKVPNANIGEYITVKNLTVLGVDQENNQLLISGAVPGRRGTVVEIRG